MAYSVASYTGDGVTTTFAIPYPILSRDHVTVLVNGVSVSPSWINDGLIQLSPAPAVSATVVISRNSSRGSALVTFVDAQVLTASAMDTSSLQNLYVAQEAFDAATGSLTDAAAAASAAAAATSATNAANSATLAFADEGNAATSATNAAASATAAANSAASITNVWHLNAANVVTNAQRATIDPNVTYDLVGATLSASFDIVPAASPLAVTAGKFLTTFHSEGTYVLNALSAVAPIHADFVIDPTSNTTGSVYAYKSRVKLNAGAAGYGCYSEIDVSGNTGVASSIYPLYLKVTNTNALGLPVGSLATLECGGPYNGYGIQVMGSGSSPSIAYPFVVRSSVSVGGGAFWYNGQAGNQSDFLLYNQAGDPDFRFRVDHNGSMIFHLAAAPQRLWADFSNATRANRFLFQDYGGSTFGTPNTDTHVGALPSGTNTQASWEAYGASDPDNTHVGKFGVNVIANTVGIDSAKNGTGVVRDMVFSFAGVERVRIDNGGKLGIGTAAPVEMLDVKPAVNQHFGVTNGTAGPQLVAFTDGFGAWLPLQINSGGNVYLSDGGGKVGIGTTAPGGALDVMAANADPTASYGTLNVGSTDAAAADKGGCIVFSGSNSGTARTPFAAIVGRKTNATAGDNNGYLAFYTRQQFANPAEHVRITEVGFVGIGTTAPTFTLDVAGTVRAPNFTNQSDPGVQWSMDACGASGTAIVMATGATHTLLAGSGLLIINLFETGSVGVFICGGGVTTLIAQTGTEFVVGAPAAGKFGVLYNGSSAYQLSNNTGASRTIGAGSIRTRPAP